MREHNTHSRSTEHEHQHTPEPAPRPGWKLHRDWRAWTAVVLTLGAMATYVLSFDESLAPAGPQPSIPASAGLAGQ